MKLAIHINQLFWLSIGGAAFSRQTHKHSQRAQVQFYLYFHVYYEFEYVKIVFVL